MTKFGVLERCFGGEQACGTLPPSSIPVMTLKPDGNLELTNSLLNCTYRHKRAAVAPFGLVCWGSSHSMWAKGHVSLSLALSGSARNSIFCHVAVQLLLGVVLRQGQGRRVVSCWIDKSLKRTVDFGWPYLYIGSKIKLICLSDKYKSFGFGVFICGILWREWLLNLNCWSDGIIVVFAIFLRTITFVISSENK